MKSLGKVKGFLKKYIVQICMAILLAVLTIIFKQRFIKVLPCFVSLFVYYLDSKVNRFGKLLGAANCFIYSIGFFIDGLYGSVGSALLYSMPLQVATFLMWSKNKYKQGTKLRLMNADFRLLTLALTFFVANFYILIFNNVQGSAYTTLQGYQFAIGLAATVLIMFGCVEGMIINLLNAGSSLYLYFSYVIGGQVNQITYLAMSIYTMVFTIIGVINWIKMYKEQHKAI